MKNKPILMLMIAIVTISTILFAASSGTIKGVIKDEKTDEIVAFAKIVLFKEELKLPDKYISDVDGNFVIKNIAPGIYGMEVTASGYVKKYEKSVKVSANSITKVEIKLKPNQTQLQEVQIKTSPLKEKVKLDQIPQNKLYESESLSMEEPMKTQFHISNHATNAKYESGKPVLQEEFNTEQYDYLPENEFHESVHSPLSTFSIDVDGASYANVRRFINNGTRPPVDAVRVEEMINYFKYNYPQPTGNDPFSVNTEVTVCPWNKDHQLISIGLQGKQIDMKQLPPSNLVFLIDVSGSMMSPDKLPLLKKALAMLTGQMRPQDKIAITVYAGNAGLVLPSTSGNDKAAILTALESLQAGGSTAGGAGIQLAYKVAKENFISNGNNRVILATDGDFNVGVSSDGELVRIIEEKRESGIFLTVLGFGTGNLKDSRMEKLANKGNGNYAYIDNIMEAKKVLVTEMGGTLFTIAKDVKIQIEFNPSYVKAYKLIGYENRMLKNKDFNDDKKDAGELGSGHTVTALYEIIPAGSNEEVASIDPLKYQRPLGTPSEINEILTVKLRYKEPQGTTSKLITRTLKSKTIKYENASQNLKFASAVAAFGLVLRNSPYKGIADYDMIIKIARSAKGDDHDGYRAEFIRLVEMASIIK